VKLVYFGDVVGRAAREAVMTAMPELRRKLGLDFLIVNGENAAGGFGITDKICKEFYAAGADVITTGNHVWDQKETLGTIGADPKLLRPANFPPQTPGAGSGLYTTTRGKKVFVIQVMGRIFMEPLDCPFAAVDQALSRYRLAGNADVVIVDIHAEATSEKMAMGHFCDGRASMVVGSHSHVPTADAQVLPGGTAYQTDAGMCGDYNSVIGMDKEQPLQRFVRKIPTGKFEAAQGEPTLCGVYLETDDKSGLAKTIAPLRMGGRLAPVWPV
jgi:2',3'-cyclic-nucleotide 2'-phosphodiesterase